ncbi:hypothetical protein SteCoe_3351 [Stentor coeruleus]|uniref:DNA polymerase delta subunit 3 n=1 Tax=Stentor coeruleus TaxID=5963 RepID=A0A1R2CXC6_9CILI|nr:hypothetical protein SteCoe_3351 [Stentor coeruleus]
MSEREKAQTILQDIGYLSKNILARQLNTSMKESQKVLESLAQTQGVKKIYSIFTGSEVVFTSEKSPKSNLYALFLEDYIINAFEIEFLNRDSFYNETIVYPPSNIGIYIQPERKFIVPSPYQQSSTVKAPIKTSNKPPVTSNASIISTIIPPAPIKSTILTQGNKKTQQKTISFASIIEKNPNPTLKNENLDIEMKTEDNSYENKEYMEIDKKEIDTKISTPVMSFKEKKAMRNDTPYPHKVKNEDFNDILANKNVYAVEEDSDDDDRKKLDFVEIKDECQELKEKSLKVRPCKKSKVLSSCMVFEPRMPIVTKKKITKTREYLDDRGRLITEDYTSEEELVINPMPIPLVKKQVKQTTLFGFCKQ